MLYPMCSLNKDMRRLPHRCGQGHVQQQLGSLARSALTRGCCFLGGGGCDDGCGSWCPNPFLIFFSVAALPRPPRHAWGTVRRRKRVVWYGKDSVIGCILGEIALVE